MSGPEHSPIQREVSRALETVLHNYKGLIIDDFEIAHIVEDVSAEASLGLIGLRGAADILGVSPQRIKQLENDNKMPEPAAHVENGQRITRIWLEKDIITFGKERQAAREAHKLFLRQSLVEQQNTTEA